MKPVERTAYLSSVCASDQELRAEVESLLAAHEEPGTFIDEPPFKAVAEVLAGASAKAGRMIGHYRILHMLGKGGMGEVYLALDTRLDRSVALKLLPAHFTSDHDRVLRFIQEAKAASALNHPNIITIYEIGVESGTHFIATEFIEGQMLRHMIDGSRMDLGDLLEIVIQVAGALSAAHKNGIVHRDAKPENIMVRPDGLVKVLDFGLAKLIGNRGASTRGENSATPQIRTAPGLILGTLRYMSPEQSNGQPVDARTDIFTLGVVLYELIAGRAPFEGDNPIIVIESILTAEPPPLTQERRDVPPELQRIVSKALHKNKEQRYQTCEEMIVDLKRLKQELEQAAKSTTATDQTDTGRKTVVMKIINDAETKIYPADQSNPRNLVTSLALIIVIAAAIIGMIWWLMAK
ncbi:MAG: serine/threonine protein kinase [Acidobacteria bacterium]|nr:serine/threonine protein kinase [Acidobacteriota bacterium]